jgi:glycerol-3-phosphate acyltransferase PlsY
MTQLYLSTLSYLLGSILFGVVVAKIKGIDNLRTSGSGNVGATNITRVSGNKKLGIVVALLDGLKGTIAIVFARYFSLTEFEVATVGTMSIVGHIFPLWHSFKGGKGIATFVGVNLALDWRVGLVMSITWLATFKITKISSLASLAMVAISILIHCIYSSDAAPIVVSAILIIVKHRDNIKRIISGKESKVL